MKKHFLTGTTHVLSLFVCTAFLIFLAQNVTLAGSAAWNDTGSDWNTSTDWTPNTVPNAATDTATFNLANTFTSVGVSQTTQVASTPLALQRQTLSRSLSLLTSA